MPNENRAALMQLRLEQANQSLKAADILLKSGAYKDAANRSYYSIFHAMRAVLALDCYDSKKHSGIISEFNKRYIKKGLLSNECSEIIRKAFDVRNSSDYDDYYIISKDDVIQQIENANIFFTAVEDYINVLFSNLEVNEE